MQNYTGNRNAQKWGPEKVKSILGTIKQTARESEPETLFISEALADLDISRKAWSYWKHIYAADEDIIDLMEVIEGIFQAKLTRGARNGAVPTTFAIFSLKHNYQWSDRPQMADSLYIELQNELRPDLNHRSILAGGESYGVLPLEELAATLAQNSQQRRG
jgi:hypothetical protein